MSELSVDDLARCLGIPRARAAVWAAPLNAAMQQYGVTTPHRQAAFLAQIGHESARLRYVRELWGPTPAQRRYEWRKDLGNVQPGDGKKFMGRGLIQVTGRANYARCAQALGLPLLERPQLLEHPKHAADSAGWFWQSNGLNVYADRGDFIGLTRRINGGTNGLADRQALWARCKKVLGVQP